MDDDTPVLVSTGKATGKATTKRLTKRVALSSPPNTTSLITKDDIREVVGELLQSRMQDVVDQITKSMTNLINQELKSLKQEVKDIRESMEFINEKYEDITQQHKSARHSFTELQSQNTDLQSMVVLLKSQINQLEQQARANNLELQCVPEKQNENLVVLTKKLGEIVGYNIQDDMISRCTRVAKVNRTSIRPRTIVIQFNSPRVRDNVLAATIKFNKSRVNDKLNSTQFGLLGERKAIFVAEHLSSSNKTLHAAARIKAKELKYKFVWVRQGRVFMRKSEDSDYILVRDLDFLNNLKAEA